MTTLAADLAELCAMEAAHGTERPRRRPHAGRRVRTVPGADVRSILAAGTGVPRPRGPGDALIVDLPVVATALARRLRHRGGVMNTAPPPLAADLDAGLRRLRLGAMRATGARAAGGGQDPALASPRSSCAPWSRPRSPRVTPRTPGAA